MSRPYLVIGYVGLFVFQIFALSCCAIESTSVKNTAAVTTPVSIQFEANWWSEEQMDGLELDNPPEKNTTLFIDKWDPSDPVSTPHPDKIEIVAQFHLPTLPTINTVTAEHRWLVGSISSNAGSTWTDWAPLIVNEPVLSSERSGRQYFTLANVDIQPKLDAWFMKYQWAYSLEVRIQIDFELNGDIGKASKVQQLPILIAD